MSLKKRILRILVVLLLVGLFVGYFAFSTFFYSPLEGGLTADVASLIPRNVDFFIAKADLRDAFDPFPRLKVMNELEKHRGWETWMASEEFRDLDQEKQITAGLTEVANVQAQLPLGMQLIDLFGGKDVSIAGYYKGKDLAQSDWAIYGHVNWAGKLGASLLAYPGLLGLEAQGINVVMEDEIAALSGPNLTRDMFVSRIRDVVIASTKREMVADALDLYARKSQDSFLQSATYFDHIQNAERNSEKDEFEIFVDVRKLYENLQISGAWPDPKSEDLAPALLGRFFQLNSLKQVIGIVGIDEGLTVDLHGEFSSELITPLQNRFYRQRGFERNQVLNDVARLAPADSCIFVYLEGNVGDLLRQVLASIEPTMLNLIEEAFQNTGEYDKIDDLINDIDESMKNRLVLIARPNDYEPDAEGPPHDDTPVPAVALVSWLEKGGDEKVATIRDLIGHNSKVFGLKGANGSSGYYKNREAGYDTHEFWSEFVPGTGVVATVNAADKFIIANSFQLLRHLMKTYFAGDLPRLSDRSDFKALMQSALAEANLMVWIDPQSSAKVLRKSARRWAEDNVPPIDWTAKRAEVEDEVIKENFAGQRRGSLSDDIQRQVDNLVQPRLDSYEDRHFREYVPKILAAKERQITYFESATSMLFMLSLNPKSFDFAARIVAPLD